MIIEIVGLPGTGKSTLANFAASQKGFEVVYLRSKITIIWFFFVHALLHPVVCVRGACLAFKHCGDYRTFWNRFIVRYAKQQKAKCIDRDKVVLIDEGPLQNLFSYPTQVLTKEDAERLYTDISLSDYVIMVCIDEAERKQRLQNRGGYLDKNYLDSRHGVMVLNAPFLQASVVVDAQVGSVDEFVQTLQSIRS